MIERISVAPESLIPSQEASPITPDNSLEPKYKPLDLPRENFGEGRIGDWAYQTITRGTGCEAPKLDEEGKRTNKLCENQAVKTVDYDVPPMMDCEITPVCGKDCATVMLNWLKDEEKRMGWHTVPGFNGHGRA